MKAPKKIYLQDEDVESEYYEGITWSKDKIGKEDTEYIRKDLIEDVIDALIRVHKAPVLDNEGTLIDDDLGTDIRLILSKLDSHE